MIQIAKTVPEILATTKPIILEIIPAMFLAAQLTTRLAARAGAVLLVANSLWT